MTRWWVVNDDRSYGLFHVDSLRKAGWYATLWATPPHHKITTAWPLEALL